MSRSNGMPEVATGGFWLLFHEGIGDPQIIQLTYNPSSEAVGEAWPFVKRACPF